MELCYGVPHNHNVVSARKTPDILIVNKRSFRTERERLHTHVGVKKNGPTHGVDELKTMNSKRTQYFVGTASLARAAFRDVLTRTCPLYTASHVFVMYLGSKCFSHT